MSETATFTTYEALIAAMRARRISLGMSQLSVDARAGLPDGYTAKIEAMLTNPTAKNARSIGRESLPLMLGALGLELATHARPSRASKKASPLNVMSERGKKGQAIWKCRTTGKQRRANARKAALARWEKHRKEKAATKRTRCAVPAKPASATV
ncbi:helix-turn-helix domain-containing protein [Bosea sp. (in: a-proteobacteria)]|uniref:helix-turn-helix domain-containing protein n=1 Tax=Bosea sp. (in: a-proteobacteria) TaxID=1871050 RepID=UPI003B3A816B